MLRGKTNNILFNIKWVLFLFNTNLKGQTNNFHKQDSTKSHLCYSSPLIKSIYNLMPHMLPQSHGIDTLSFGIDILELANKQNV